MTAALRSISARPGSSFGRVPSRMTNLSLLGVLFVAFATGALAYGFGTSWARSVVIAHGVAGLALVFLSPWKSVIVRRGLMRKRSGISASLVFTVLLVVTLVSGVLHSSGLLVSAGPVTAMQVHVAAALLCIPLALFHVLVRPAKPRRTDLSRRNILRSAVVVAGAGAAYAAVEGGLSALKAPGADRRFTGSFETGTDDPEAMPVTQWLNDQVPNIDPRGWSLTVRSDDRMRRFTLDDLERYKDRMRATLDCTGGWFAEQDWEGAFLTRLTGDMSGRSVLVTSATGYTRRFPARDAGDLLLATRVSGRALSAGHGFPARIVAPGRRGFWWVKWVTEIEVSDTPWWLQSPFPLT